jgi:hypothetical protein
MRLEGFEMNKIRVSLFACLMVVGCAHKLKMDSVINSCVNQNDTFPQISACIQEVYTKDGRTPNANSVHAFYAELAVIDEDYRSGKISDAQAKASLYRAYGDTVDKSNRANKGTVCMPMNGMMFCN